MPRLVELLVGELEEPPESWDFQMNNKLFVGQTIAALMMLMAEELDTIKRPNFGCNTA